LSPLSPRPTSSPMSDMPQIRRQYYLPHGNVGGDRIRSWALSPVVVQWDGMLSGYGGAVGYLIRNVSLISSLHYMVGPHYYLNHNTYSSIKVNQIPTSRT
jgi:hypothetical protein